MKNNKNRDFQPVDLREIKFVEGVGLVRIGEEEYTDTPQQSQKRIDNLIEAIIYSKPKQENKFPYKLNNDKENNEDLIDAPVEDITKNLDK